MAQGGRFAKFDDYDFAYFVRRHLEDPTPDSLDILHRALALLEADGRHSWFAARQSRHEVAAFAADVGAIRDFLGAQISDYSAADPQRVALLARYALLVAVLVDAANAVPTALAEALVAGGIWTRQDAVDWARLSPDSQTALDTLRSALRAEGAARRPDLVETVIDTVSSIASTDDRGLLIVDLLDDLPPGSERLAVSLLLQIDNEGGRLAGVGPLLDRLQGMLNRPTTASLLDELLDSFQQQEIRATAAAMAAARASGELRTKWFATAVDAARKGAQTSESQRGVRSVLSSAALQQITEHGPLDLLTTVFDDLDSGALQVDGDIARPRTAFLARLAEIDPDAISEILDSLDDPTSRVVKKLAVTFAQRGDHGRALDITERISYGASASDVLQALVTVVPPVSFERLLSQALQTGSRFWYQPILAYLARDPERLAQGVDQHTLARLASAAPDPEAGITLRAYLCAVLDPTAFSALLQEIQSEGDQADHLWAAVAGLLDLEGVRRGLAACTSRVTDDARIALLSRMVTLGAVGEAIPHLRGIGTHWLSTLKMVAALAPLVPPSFASALAEAVPPAPVLKERILARSAIADLLAAERIDEIISDADLLNAADRCECLKVLAEVAQRHPEQIARRMVADALARVTCILASDSLQAAAAIADALDALRRLEVMGWHVDTFLEVAHDRIGDESERPGLRLAWLLATVAIVDRSQLPALAATAVEIVGEDGAMARWLVDRSEPPWRRLVLDAMLSQTLVTVAYLLPALSECLEPSDGSVLQARAEDAYDQDVRLAVLGEVAELLDASTRTGLAAQELARLPHVLRPGRAGFTHEALISLDPTLGDAVRERFTADVYDTPDDLIMLVAHDGHAAERAVCWLKDHHHDERRGTVLQREVLRRAIATQDARMAEAVLSLPEAARRDKVLDGLVGEVPATWLPMVAESASGFGATDSLRREIAVRAAGLGEVEIAVKQLGSLTTRRPDAYAETFAAASPTGRVGLREHVETLPKTERLPVLAAMATRVESDLTAELTREVVALLDDVDGWTRLTTLRTLATAALPHRWVLAIWKALLSDGERIGRSDVLINIREAAPTLASKLGSTFAVALDDAIIVGSKDRWP